MFLKKIQATGFKSFADKITIPLDRGITGIVGPNGSGKSNVIDAVRWVMGEQNARNLRGKVATDIIFAGSANRKPLGMAEVTLIFDNTDESAFCPPEYRHEAEISLTRRLYADGQREYLINRKPCRLKDIVNFFTLTGLGGRSYSMIQQGQVERILNAKPEEMRVIIEEAAGTLIYKMRRDEALKKLEHTQENLSRIEDIVAELERQRHSLQGQMEKAQKWREATSDLEQRELKLFGHNFQSYRKQLEDIDEILAKEKETESACLAEMAKFEAQQIELQNRLDEADPGLEGLRETVSSLREQIARAESVISGSDERIDERKLRLDSLDKEISEDTETLESIELQLSTAQQELSQARTQANELKGQIESFQTQVDAVDEEAQVYQNQIEDYQDELRNIERLLETNSLRCENINRERDKLSSELSETEQRFEQLQADITDAKKLVDEKQSKVDEKQQGLDVDLEKKNDLEQQLAELEKSQTQLSHERDKLKERYFEIKARFNSLEELLAESSDIAETVATLKECEPNSDALGLGLLTDYISFNDRANELSQHARTVFERWTERLVLTSLSDLNELIKIAHKHDSSAIPVSVIDSARIIDQDKIQKWAEENEASSIADYLKITKNTSSIKSLIDRLFLLTSLELSPAEINDIPPGAIVFTNKGLYLNSQEDFVIGSSKERSGILTRKNEMETLGEEIKSIESELAGCQSSIDDKKSKQNELRIELSEVEQKLKNQNQDVLDVLHELQSVKQLLEHKQQLFDEAKKHQQSLEQREQSLVEELNEQGQARLNLAQEQDRVNEELDQVRENFETIEEKRTEVFRAHENRKLEFAKVEARTQALESSFNNTQSQLDRVQATLNRKFEEKSRLSEQIDEIKNEHERCLADMQTLLQKRETLENELSEKREENATILEELRAVDQELKKVREKYGKSEKLISSKSVEAERLKVELEGVVEDASEKYHIDISQYEFEFDEEFDAKKESTKVHKLRNKIEGLGAINMMAIEEYENLMQRHEFITAQREEVLNSIAVLEDALEEIEETTRKKFIETYEKINEEFSNLYPILFPGGSGHISLTTPDDPLNSGVEILARLPGKKLQRMTLLSGGEKALTAISLIFALLKTKPTPFCFLDEVDAPLDEANVGRYNRVLETLAERFQFIVITHNRRTMEVLDTLFGVTMQEPGVSKIVGVDMKKDIPSHLKKAFKEESSRPVEGASLQ